MDNALWLPPFSGLGTASGAESSGFVDWNFRGIAGASEDAAELRLRVGWALAKQVKRKVMQRPAAATKRPKRIRFLFALVSLAC